MLTRCDSLWLAGTVRVWFSAGDPADTAETVERVCARPDRMRHGCRRILVALDGSAFAERVLPSVELFTGTFGAEVTLARVVAPALAAVGAEASVGAVDLERSGAGRGQSVEEMRTEAAAYLNGIGERLQARGLMVECESLEGPASDDLLRLARQHAVDLIAMTTHGRIGADRMLFGSVAEDVLRHTPCPVLLVRAREGA